MARVVSTKASSAAALAAAGGGAPGGGARKVSFLSNEQVAAAEAAAFAADAAALLDADAGVAHKPEPSADELVKSMRSRVDGGGDPDAVGIDAALAATRKNINRLREVGSTAAPLAASLWGE